MKKVAAIPIVVGVLGTITTKFEKYIESLGIDVRTGCVQKSTLLGTTRIIRKVYTILLSTQEMILLWDLWHLVDVCSYSKIRDTKTSALWENIEHNNSDNNNEINTDWKSSDNNAANNDNNKSFSDDNSDKSYDWSYLLLIQVVLNQIFYIYE